MNPCGHACGDGRIVVQFALRNGLFDLLVVANRKAAEGLARLVAGV
jgi:hypothetical protein